MILVLKRPLRSVGFRFDALAVFLMCQHYGIDLSEMDRIPKSEYTTSWVWSAHRSYRMWMRKKDQLNRKQAERFISKLRKSEWDDMTAAMLAGQGESKGDSKKKVSTGTTSLSQDGRQE